jgi:HEPN domain-containing protein
MANKESAVQWVTKAYHDLSSAQILYAANHYTDTIAGDLQQALEKCLKSFMAYGNEPVKKTHDLVELSKLVEQYIQFGSAEMDLLDAATTYYTHDRYPGPVALPSRQQVKEILEFAKKVFAAVCQILEIDENQLK